MNPLDIIKTLDHHAYFIHSFKDSVEHLKSFLKEKLGIEHRQNPDFFHEKYEVFGIDESRRIKEIQTSKSFIQDSKRIFIIEADDMTHEAQNSLLKIFEEPNKDNHFFLVMPSIESLLPTLKSRLQIVNRKEQKNSSLEAEKFLKLSKKEKIEFVDELAEKISDKKATKADAQEFLSSLEMAVYKHNNLNNSRSLKAILKARDYMNDRSPSVKQLLEYVALNI